MYPPPQSSDLDQIPTSLNQLAQTLEKHWSTFLSVVFKPLQLHHLSLVPLHPLFFFYINSI